MLQLDVTTLLQREQNSRFTGAISFAFFQDACSHSGTEGRVMVRMLTSSFSAMEPSSTPGGDVYPRTSPGGTATGLLFAGEILGQLGNRARPILPSTAQVPLHDRQTREPRRLLSCSNRSFEGSSPPSALLGSRQSALRVLVSCQYSKGISGQKSRFRLSIAV